MTDKPTTTTKRDLVERVAGKHADLPREQVAAIAQTFLDEVVASLAKNERIELRGFGVLTPRERKARRARNPKTGTVVEVPASRTVAFKLGKEFKDRLAGKTDATEAAPPAPPTTQA